MDALFDTFPHHRYLVGYAGTLDDLVGVENLFFRMVSFFPFDVVTVEHLLVFVFDGRHVGNKYIKSFFLGEYGCTGTTFARS